MTVLGWLQTGRRAAPIGALAVILVLAAAALLHQVGAGDDAETRAAILRYQRIAAELPGLEAALRNRPAAETGTERGPDNPSIAAALWQSRLSRLAASRGLQLASAEPLFAEPGGSGKPTIALELVGPTAGLLSFVYEVERGTSPMAIARLEVTPATQADANAAPADPQLRIRLQAIPPNGVP